MGGKVLELESDRLIKQGLQRGMQQGLQRGMQQGRTEVIQVIKLLRQGLTIGETARKLKLPEEEVQQIWEETEGQNRIHPFKSSSRIMLRKLLLKGKTVEEAPDILDMSAEQIRNLMKNQL